MSLFPPCGQIALGYSVKGHVTAFDKEMKQDLYVHKRVDLQAAIQSAARRAEVLTIVACGPTSFTADVRKAVAALQASILCGKSGQLQIVKLIVEQHHW